MKVTNEYGVKIDFDVAVKMMDDEIRERLHAEGIDTEQAFFDAYANAHWYKYHEVWELAKEYPVY